MNYILKDCNEPQRLNEQCQIEEFSLARELEHFDLSLTSTLLDAGCGSGVLCRYIEQMVPGLNVSGCDISENSLAYCQSQKIKNDSTFFVHNLLESATPKKYDAIVNRLVLHHLSISQQKKFLTHLRDSLNPGGKICVIDTDGLFLNLGTTSQKLLDQMELAKNRFGGNVASARYLPAIFSELGFKNVSWDIVLMDFRGESKYHEVEQWRLRFASSFEFYVSVFGSEFEAHKFIKLYLDEAKRPETTLFYNKFIVSGEI